MAEEMMSPTSPPLPSNVDIMISLARIDEKVKGMTDAKRSEHDVIMRDMARVELESRQRDSELGLHLAKIEESMKLTNEALTALKVSYARAAGMAAIVAGLVAAVLSAVVSYVLK